MKKTLILIGVLAILTAGCGTKAAKKAPSKAKRPSAQNYDKMVYGRARFLAESALKGDQEKVNVMSKRLTKMNVKPVKLEKVGKCVNFTYEYKQKQHIAKACNK